jgi:hypothetical protein
MKEGILPAARSADPGCADMLKRGRKFSGVTPWDLTLDHGGFYYCGILRSLGPILMIGVINE